MQTWRKLSPSYHHLHLFSKTSDYVIEHRLIFHTLHILLKVLMYKYEMGQVISYMGRQGHSVLLYLLLYEIKYNKS